MRRKEDHPRVVDDLAQRRDSFTEHDAAEITKIGQRVVRRRHQGDAVSLRLVEAKRYVANHSCVDVEKEGRLNLFRQAGQELDLSHLAGELAVAPHDRYVGRETTDVSRRVGDQQDRIVGKLTLANATPEVGDVLRSPGEKHDCTATHQERPWARGKNCCQRKYPIRSHVKVKHLVVPASTMMAECPAAVVSGRMTA